MALVQRCGCNNRTSESEKMQTVARVLARICRCSVQTSDGLGRAAEFDWWRMIMRRKDVNRASIRCLRAKRDERVRNEMRVWLEFKRSKQDETKRTNERRTSLVAEEASLSMSYFSIYNSATMMMMIMMMIKAIGRWIADCGFG